MAAIILMLALMANSTYLQAFRANEINGRNDNNRVRDSQFSVNRGPILIGSTPIAQSKPTNDRFKYQRTYPSGQTYAPVTGFYSYLFGRSGVELTMNAELNGSDPSMAFRRIIDVISNRPQPRQLDGDLIDTGDRLLAEVIPGAFWLCVPQPAGAADLAEDADTAARRGAALLADAR